MPEKVARPRQRAATKEKVSQNDCYVCDSCGLVVSVDEVCGCMDACDIVCCGEPMRKKTTRARAAKK